MAERPSLTNGRVRRDAQPAKYNTNRVDWGPSAIATHMPAAVSAPTLCMCAVVQTLPARKIIVTVQIGSQGIYPLLNRCVFTYVIRILMQSNPNADYVDGKAHSLSASAHTKTSAISSEFKNFLADIEQLISEATSMTGDELAQAKTKFQSSINNR